MPKPDKAPKADKITKNDPVVYDQAFLVDENSDVSIQVDAQLSEHGTKKGATLTYSIVGGNDAGLFVIDPATGIITTSDGSQFDFESGQSAFLLQVQVTETPDKGAPHSTTVDVTIDVGDVNEAPDAPTLSGNFVAENDVGAVIGAVATSDPDDPATANGTVTYSVSDARFEIVNGTLKLKDGVSLNHEAESSVSVTVTATDGGGLTSSQTFTVDVGDVNEAPIDIDFGTSVVEGAANGTVVHVALAVDPDVGDTHTYALLDDAGGRFAVDPATGQVTVANGTLLDYESATSHDITIQATDSGGLTYTETFTIDVTDANEAPTAISLSGASVAENDAGAVIGALSVTDPDDPASDFGSHSFAVSDARFEVVNGTLKLKDGISLDHEAGETVSVAVTATDGGGLAKTSTFTIAVQDVNEAPTAISLSNASVDENSAGAVVGTVSVADQDAATESFGTHAYTVSDSRFEIANGALKLKDGISLDFEAEPTVNVTVTATDGGGLATSQTFTVAVNDLPEGLDITLANDAVDENLVGADIGAILLNDGTVSTGGFTFSVDDPRFEVVNGVLKLKDGESLDFETASSVTMQITATDPATGLTATEPVTVIVGDVVESPTTIDATTSGDSLVYGGFTVSGAGDVNGDGFDDLVLSNPMAGGTTYVVFGGAGGVAPSFDATTVDGTNGFAVTGISVSDPFSAYVSDAGDINGDGFDDVIIGAHSANGGDGAAYVVFGQADGWSSSLDVSQLDGTNGFRIGGGVAGGELGFSVSGAGDIDGDGYDDLIVSANGTGDTAGYVVFGDAGGWTGDVDLATLDGTDGFRIDGMNGTAINGAFNYSVSGAGDINGDGFDDLVIGNWVNTDAGAGSGTAYVVYGTDAGWGSSIDLRTLDGSNGFSIDGVAVDERLGFSVSGAGDINGDGIEDFLIGAVGAQPDGTTASGASYVVFGQEGGMPAGIDLSTLDGTDGFRLDGSGGEQAGFSVSSVGDMNGDGYDDLVVGATFSDGSLGAAYVIFGKADGWTADVDLANFNTDLGFELVGIAGSDYLGVTVSGAGDLDGDGFADLVVGVPAFTSGAYGDIVYGGDFTLSVSNDLTDTSGNDTLVGSTVGESFVSGLGDDMLFGNGGADVFYAGAGDDTISVADTAFQRVDGGSGFDTLALDGAGMTLDLTAIGDATIAGIERVDLTGSGDNSLTLEMSDLLQASDEGNALFVSGDVGDSVTMVGDWSNTGTTTVDGVDYGVFEVAGVNATLYVEVDVSTSVAPIV